MQGENKRAFPPDVGVAHLRNVVCFLTLAALALYDMRRTCAMLTLSPIDTRWACSLTATLSATISAGDADYSDCRARRTSVACWMDRAIEYASMLSCSLSFVGSLLPG